MTALPGERPAPGAPRLLQGPAGRALALLTAVNLLASLDRFVVAALVESLRADLWLTDARLGGLMAGLVLVSLLAAPAFGALGDRRGRPRALAIGVALFGVATMLSGAARGYWTLLAAQAAAGMGVAAAGAVATGLVADAFAPPRRGRALALFLAAIPLGSALGYVVGGLVDRAFGWRAAFVAAGAPGLLLAAACLRLRDPPRGAGEHGWLARGEGGIAATYRRLRAHRPWRSAVLGWAAWTFAAGGMAFWMPAFLERARGVPRPVAAVQFGVVVVMTGFAGTYAGGHVAEALRRRLAEAERWVAGVATLAAAPLALAVLTAYRPSIYLVALVLAQLLLFAGATPMNAALARAVPPAERASAVALSALAVHLLGDVPAPVLIGLLSDRTSLGRAALLVPLALLVAGLVWTWSAWRGERAARGRPA